MNMKVIELNDAGIKVADKSGIVLLSPGFALSRGKSLLLGEEAEQQARLHPTNSYNKYWHELSLDPLAHGNGIRHYADIAYAQLQHLTAQAGIEGEVLFAVPGNFTRPQLAILLGLAKQCAFQTVGVVDSALAAGIATAGEQPLVYAELQQHQVVLTKLKVVDKRLTIDRVVQIPGVGSQSVIDQLMQMATNAFIQQCRFNPQHNAESEQQLYNALPHWWRQPAMSEEGLLLELRVGSTVHTAKLPRESIVNKLNSHYHRINQQLAAIAADADTRVLLNPGIATLPGLQTVLGSERNLQVLDTTTVSASCLQFHQHIRSNEQGMRLVTTLPLVATATSAPGAAGARQQATADAASTAPTHLLYGNRAFPLARVRISNQPALNGSAAAHTLQLALNGLPEEPAKIHIKGNDVFIDTGKLEYLLNDKRTSGRAQLAVGDRIQFSPDTAVLSLIQVD